MKNMLMIWLFFYSFATSRDKTLHFVLRLVIEGKQYNL